MPCVLPVLSLKLLSLAKKAHLSRKESLKHGIAYSTGVLTCFTILGITMIAIQHAGVLVGWGFQLQSPMVITLLAVLMFLVGLNLIGAFTLPDILGSTGDTLTRSNNASGSFFTGALAAIAATPCTAPFMAPAVGFALTQHPSTALLIFVMIGVGMASPYLLISLFPTCLRFLPRSGAWMETLRQFFAFPMFATAAWLLWVMTRQACTDALAPALSILVLVAFITWTHRSIHTRSLKIILLVSSISCVIYTLTLIERPSSFKSNEEATHIAYSTEKLSQLRKEGTPVLVNATADWCLTCKVNEITTLSSDAIALHFKTQGITYMIADWTKRDDAITKFLREHQRQGVPTYVFYPPHKEGIVLPQILSVETVKKMTCVTGCEAH